MKKIITSFIFLLFINSICKAQDPIPEIPQAVRLIERSYAKEGLILYNFDSKTMHPMATVYQIHSSSDKKTITYKTVRKLWYNNSVNFKVIINPYLYDVSIASRQVNDGGLIDSMGMRLFTSYVLKFSENRASLDTAKNSAAVPEKKPEPKSSDAAADSLLKKVPAANNAEKAIIRKQITKSLDVEEISDKTHSGDLTSSDFAVKPKVKVQIDEELLAIEREKRKVDIYNIKEDTFHARIKDFYDRTKALQSYHDICENAVIHILQDGTRDQILESLNQYTTTEGQGSIDTFLAHLSPYFWQYKNWMDGAYQNLQLAYADLESSVFKARYFDGVSIKADSTIKGYADTLYKQFNRLNPEVLAKGLMSMITNLKNPECFTFSAPSTLLIKDSIIYAVETKPSARFESLISKYGLKTAYVRKFDYSVPVKGNFKVNFSVGAAFMFGGLKEKDYHFDTPLESLPNDDSSVKIIEKKGANNFMPAIAAYVHGYIKLGGWFTPALTVGLSTNPNDLTNASYFAGLSMICGQQSRLIFTLGRAASSINVIKPKYDINKSYSKKDFLNIQESDLVKKGFKSGWFFGVSYNISNNR